MKALKTLARRAREHFHPIKLVAGADLNRRPLGHELRPAVLKAAFWRFRGVFDPG